MTIVDSAGTAGYHIGSPPDIRSIKIADKYNIDLRNQRARQFNKADFDEFDIIYAMDTNNYKHLIELAQNQKEREKVQMIMNEINPNLNKSVPDPYYGGENGFQEIYDLLDKACNKIVTQIE
jgi:protein-tyrosine phosphatase